MTTRAFDLPDHLAHKADPLLIDPDEHHFAAIAESLDRAIADLTDGIETTRKRAAGSGQQAMDRDLEVHRLTARLRALRRYNLDLCLGRMVFESGETVYVGRFGLTDADGRRLLVDWRSPAAEPFFAATHGDPRGLVSRRRYRWTAGRISDYWDEVFTAEGLDGPVALDDDSALIASLSTSRSPRMRDVLGTIQADQDAIIRASSKGALVVDGGPGTGKTVVALHRAAYLLYSDPRLGSGRGSVLFIGPHQPYLAYVEDVLPSLGEEGVQTCTLRDLLPEGEGAQPEGDPEVARLKATRAMVEAVVTAVRLYEEPPAEGLEVETPWVDLWVSADDWADAFGAPDPGTPHNEARGQILDALLDILVAKAEDEDVDPEALREALAHHRELIATLRNAWPVLEPADVVGDLWDVPAYLRHCAPWLEAEDVKRLQRNEPQAWTVSDLPLLDAARRRLGDVDHEQRARERAAATRAQQREMDDVIEHLVATDDSEMQVMSMLRVNDLQYILVEEATEPDRNQDRLEGPFAHVVVDEAQELTDAEWQMLISRCPSRSFTIVGDRAQARHGFTEPWEERLTRVGLDRVTLSSLSINYRTPEEVMTAAEPVIRAAIPDANVPTSIRSTGVPVRYGHLHERDEILQACLADHVDGIACVIGDPTFEERPRVRSLSPENVKGLEFDLVVLVEDGVPDDEGIERAVDRYVAMTRATQVLVVLTPSGRP